MWQGLFQIALTLLPIGIITPILGKYLAAVFQADTPTRVRSKSGLSWLDPIFSHLERAIYRFSQIDRDEVMTGWQYARSIRSRKRKATSINDC